MTLAPPTSSRCLNVVALISGGKDSMFSLLHCLANNHKVVALANLYPAKQVPGPHNAPEETSSTEEWDNDVDSFMYQTAGHNLIPLYSDALSLPLYRQEITGGAQDASLSYSRHDEDETEALVPLLLKVKTAHPEVNAVSSGAILSTYQRTRVESVAVRLGLIPLAFLWQYPSLPPPSPGGLLEDMRKAGLDVRIIKVASGGLTSALLWCNLATSLTRMKLEKAVSRFGGSVLGEGGEYETMVVCGPSSLLIGQDQFRNQGSDANDPSKTFQSIDKLWKGRIEVSNEDRHVVKENGSDNATLLFKHGSGRIAVKNLEAADTRGFNAARPLLRIPNMWDKQFDELLRQVSLDFLRGFAGHANASLEELNEKTTVHTQAQNPLPKLELERLVQSSQVDNLCVISNLTGVSIGNTVQDQMRAVKQKLLDTLSDLNRPASSIVFTTILLDSMIDFVAINAIYGELFEKPNPPARVTVACPLPDGIKVMMSVTINMVDKSDALHVQSRSYWAPANIGPYSQAIRVPFTNVMKPSLVFIAGQIPLLPPTMALLGPQTGADWDTSPTLSPLQHQFIPRCCLSLQHLWRIGREMKVGWWTGAVAFITNGPDQPSKAVLAWRTWQKAHTRQLWGHDTKDEDDNTEIDVWDTKYGGMGSLVTGPNEEHHLPDFDRNVPLLHKAHEADSVELTEVPGFFAVEVDGLPRGSDIEWQSLGVAQGEVSSTLTTIIYGESRMEVSSCIIGSTRTCISFVNVPFHDLNKTLVSRSLSRAVDWLRNASGPDGDMLITIYTSEISLALPLVSDVRAQVVPCHAVWGLEGRRLSAGIVAQFKIRHGMEG